MLVIGVFLFFDIIIKVSKAPSGAQKAPTKDGCHEKQTACLNRENTRGQKEIEVLP